MNKVAAYTYQRGRLSQNYAEFVEQRKVNMSRYAITIKGVFNTCIIYNVQKVLKFKLFLI